MRKKVQKVNMSPGQRVRLVRSEAGLTQQEFAEELGGLNEKYISMVECGTRNLSKKLAVKISEHFPNTTPDWLLCLNDFRTNAERNANELFKAIGQAQEESDYMFSGLWAFSSVNGYTIETPNLKNKDIADVLKELKNGYTIKKGDKKIVLSLEEMNRLENELCDLVNTRLKYLFMEKGEVTNGKPD